MIKKFEQFYVNQSNINEGFDDSMAIYNFSKRNFTTKEQSKRILEIGIPANSADCYIENSLNKVEIIQHENFDALRKIGRRYGDDDIPSWSVGQLIYIATVMNNGVFNIKNDNKRSLIEVLIENLSRYSDFSKLEVFGNR